MGLGAHVWALPDCSMMSCDARGRGRLGPTVADDVTCARRTLSDLKRPSMSVNGTLGRARRSVPTCGREEAPLTVRALGGIPEHPASLPAPPCTTYLSVIFWPYHSFLVPTS